MAHSPTPTSYRKDDVFGINREIPLNYVTRKSADERLVDSLSRKKHIVIYGSSKQGKTCLRRHCLLEADYITVQCSNRWGIDDVHSNILKRAGYEVTLSSKQTLNGRNKISASIGIPKVVVANLGGEYEASEGVEISKKALDLDPADANDIIDALKLIEFSKFVVLEDFHYLPRQTQIDFAYSLKAFHEKSSLTFMVVGVWLEENRLIVYNGDLAGRVVSINADKWSPEELKAVISSGADKLNIEFSVSFSESLIREANESVYIVQEVCNLICEEEGVYETQSGKRQVGSLANVTDLVRRVVNQQSGRYLSFISQFAGGFQKTELKMYKWLLYPVLTSSTQQLEEGLPWSELNAILKAHHPSGEGLNPGNLTQALQSTASLQVEKNIKPIILDYDETNRRLNVVDRGFLIWLAYQNRDDLLEETDLPTSVKAERLSFDS